MYAKPTYERLPFSFRLTCISNAPHMQAAVSYDPYGSYPL